MNAIQTAEEAIEETVESIVHPKHLRHHGEMGDRFAARAALVIGSPRFLLCFVASFVAWAAWNTLTPWPFDPFPFVLYITLISVLAIIMTNLVLKAQVAQGKAREKIEDNAFRQTDEVHTMTRQLVDLNQRTVDILRSQDDVLAQQSETLQRMDQIIQELQKLNDKGGYGILGPLD